MQFSVPQFDRSKISDCSAVNIESTVSELLELQQEVYRAELREGATSFSAKLEAARRFSFLLREGSELKAYLITLPCSQGDLPSLDADTATIPSQPDTLYIHDLAVSKTVRGRGYGVKLVEHALCLGGDCNLKTACLVAVQQSEAFWAKFGFQVVNEPAPQIAQKLSSFGAGAAFMNKSL